MKSLTRLAASLLLIVGVSAAIIFSLGSSAPAFAEIREKIISAKSLSCVSEILMGMPGKMTTKMFILNPGYMRHETTTSDPQTLEPFNIITIINYKEGKILSLIPTLKQATMIDISGMPEDVIPKNIVDEFAKMGEKEGKFDRKEKLNGREMLVYIVSKDGDDSVLGISSVTTTIWVDAETERPVKMVMKLSDPVEMIITLDQFEWNPVIDPALFSLDIPEDYQIDTMDMSNVTEKDLVNSLKAWTDLTQGQFPDRIDQQSMEKLIEELEDKKPDEQYEKEVMALTQRLTRGMFFAAMQLKKGDFHYIGKGVTTQDKDAIICYWLPTDASQYRAIFGDLTIGDVDEKDLPE